MFNKTISILKNKMYLLFNKKKIYQTHFVVLTIIFYFYFKFHIFLIFQTVYNVVQGTIIHNILQYFIILSFKFVSCIE